MKVFKVEIQGVTALLQHRFGEQAEEPGAARKVLVQRGTPREEAEAGQCVARHGRARLGMAG